MAVISGNRSDIGELHRSYIFQTVSVSLIIHGLHQITLIPGELGVNALFGLIHTGELGEMSVGIVGTAYVATLLLFVAHLHVGNKALFITLDTVEGNDGLAINDSNRQRILRNFPYKGIFSRIIFHAGQHPTRAVIKYHCSTGTVSDALHPLRS